MDYETHRQIPRQRHFPVQQTFPDFPVGELFGTNFVIQAENYIVQKYISDPLLIGGKKFDMRIYALVTSYSPLTVYLYRSGFARFTHMRYDETKITQS